jgi:hypothetical protein
MVVKLPRWVAMVVKLPVNSVYSASMTVPRATNA